MDKPLKVRRTGLSGAMRLIVWMKGTRMRGGSLMLLPIERQKVKGIGPSALEEGVRDREQEPAWQLNGRRVSTWGGTGLAITKACKNKDLAWSYAKKLYLKKEDLGNRFIDSYTLPPVKDAWDLPVFQTPIPLYSNQAIGQLYASQAPDIPPNYGGSPYYELALSKLSEAFLNAAQYYQNEGDFELMDYTKTELRRVSNYVKKVMAHNVFFTYDMHAHPKLNE